ncbi:MAG: M3 family metallopeptidase [Candidatus Zixiibacteriota bacterium]
MRVARFFIIAVSMILIRLVSCTQQPLTQEALLTTLDSLEYKMEWLDYRISLAMWELYTTGESDSLRYYQNLYGEVVSGPEIYQQLSSGGALLTDELNQRRRDILFGAVLVGKVETDRDISELRDSLEVVNINYRPEFEGAERTSGYLYSVFRTDPGRTRRELAYRAWCSVGDELAEGLEQLLRMRDQRARRLGYNSYIALSFGANGIDMTNYRALLRQLDSLSAQPYLEIIKRIATDLNVDRPEIWDLSYSYGDITTQVDRFFPADSQMNYIQRSLEGVGFDLDKMPIYYDLVDRQGKSQFAFAFPIKPPHDVRVLASLYDGMYSTRMLFHEIGHAVHYTQIAQDNPLFINNIQGAWSEAMAQTISALMDDKFWLAEYAHMPEQLIDSYLKSKRAQDIIYLRTTLVRLYFELEAYTNPNRDINKLYWDLFEKYMMLPRHDDMKPWAAIFHYTTHPVYLQNYLYADIVAAQTIDFLKTNYGSFVDNPMTSAFLIQNYYRFGGRYDWRELLKRGTDEEFNPAYFIKRIGL